MLFRYIFNTASFIGVYSVFLFNLTALFVLLYGAYPSLMHNTGNFFLYKGWNLDEQKLQFGVAAVLYGSVVTTIIALAIALPLGIGSAFYITYYTRGFLKDILVIFIKSLSFIPSVIYGIFGLFYVVPVISSISVFLNRYFAFIPIFESSNHIFGRSFLTAGFVLSLMIVSIIVSSSLEFFESVKKRYMEAVISLGYTKEEMIYRFLLRFSFKNLINTIVIATNRAIGETTAVTMTIGATYVVSMHILDSGGSTIASNIASNLLEADSLGRSALISSGLVLYLIAIALFLSLNFYMSRYSKRHGVS